MVALPTAEKKNTWTDQMDRVSDDVIRNDKLGAERAVEEDKFRKVRVGGGGSSWADIAKETDGSMVEAAKTAEAARSWDEADSNSGSLNFRLNNEKQVRTKTNKFILF
jgi:hypothetical protein